LHQCSAAWHLTDVKPELDSWELDHATVKSKLSLQQSFWDPLALYCVHLHLGLRGHRYASTCDKLAGLQPLSHKQLPTLIWLLYHAPQSCLIIGPAWCYSRESCVQHSTADTPSSGLAVWGCGVWQAGWAVIGSALSDELLML
jgi:hypothetical protein